MEELRRNGIESGRGKRERENGKEKSWLSALTLIHPFIYQCMDATHTTAETTSNTTTKESLTLLHISWYFTQVMQQPREEKKLR